MSSKNTAFLFVGQGAQYIGMCKDLYDNISVCKEIFDRGEEILDMPIKDMIFNGSKEVLMQTENAQPAIFLASVACLKALEENNIDADYSAGLSLGEYPSLVHAGAMSFEDALVLVKERGKIMGSSLPSGLGKMAALVKLSDSDVKKVIDEASKVGICEGANYNCPGQVVISGENKAIERAIEVAKDLGGRGLELAVSGPFHSSLLNDASDEFYKTIKKADIKPLKKLVYSNVLGKPYKDSDDIKLILKKHICSPVYFEKAIEDMISRGVNTFVEVGPGKALRGFVRKIDKGSNLLNVEDLNSLSDTIKYFSNK